MCPSHYLSVPALIWDAMRNMTKIRLELISYLDMYIFFEKGMGSGVSYMPNRYNKANSKYLESYDPKLESNLTIHLDANSFFWLYNT